MISRASDAECWFKSVIMENGVAAKTISAYLDLNPLRAGMVKDPADYRWNSYEVQLISGPNFV